MAKEATVTTLAQKLEVLRALALPVGRAVVTGTMCFMDVPGIIPEDIDVLCDKETWMHYQAHPDATKKTTGTGVATFEIRGAEFYTDFPGMLADHATSVRDAIAATVMREGVPFLDENEMFDWKTRVLRAKDITHLSKVVARWRVSHEKREPALDIRVRDFCNANRATAPVQA